jgi:methyl-accepting chemotaxis protein
LEEDKSVLRSTNKVVLTINSILSAFLVFGYTGEYFKGLRSLTYIILFALAVLIPLGLAAFMYLRDSSSTVMKYVTLIGYLVIYTIALFTSNSQLAFVYIFPIMLMYLLYFNLKFMAYGYSYVFVVNVISVIYKFVSQKITALQLTDITIQMAAIILFGVSIILSTKLSNKFNYTKINSLNEQREKQDHILSSILKAASILDANAKEVETFMTDFKSSMIQVGSAIDEISRGAQDTSENMTQQSVATEKIDQLIKRTLDLAKQMGELAKQSTEDVNTGFNIVNELDRKAVIVNEQSLRVEEQMEVLEKKTDEILGITTIIAGISSQTNLLSLNASIEAARAGESGKGFAVVADEIRQLAEQSKQSSLKISVILNELNEIVHACVELIQNTKIANQEQNNYITNAKTIYNNISNKANKLLKNVEEVNYKIETIVESNEQIIEGISKTAAVSQQTAASSEEANAMASTNLQNADELMKQINEIIEISNEMRNYAQ